MRVDGPIIIARPFGSTAKYCPGTIRRQPLLPNVSWCTWGGERERYVYCQHTCMIAHTHRCTDLLKEVLGRVVFQDADPSRVRSDHYVV